MCFPFTNAGILCVSCRSVERKGGRRECEWWRCLKDFFFLFTFPRCWFKMVNSMHGNVDGGLRERAVVSARKFHVWRLNNKLKIPRPQNRDYMRQNLLRLYRIVMTYLLTLFAVFNFAEWSHSSARMRSSRPRHGKRLNECFDPEEFNFSKHHSTLVNFRSFSRRLSIH